MDIARLDKGLGYKPDEGIRLLWYRRAVLAFASGYFVFSALAATILPLPSGIDWPSPLLPLYLALYPAAVGMLRHPLTARLSGWVLIGTNFAATTDFIAASGGLMGPGTVILAVLPLASIFVLGLRGTSVIGVCCVAAVVFGYEALPTNDVSAAHNYKAAFTVMLITVTTSLTLGVIGVTRSMITHADKSRQAATLASEAKSAFLANMSHEIRTPLNGVLAMSEAVLNDQLPEEARDRIRVIKDSGELLLHVINDILDVSKIEAGAFELDVQPFNGATILKRVQALYGPMAEEKGLSLIFEEPQYAVPTRLGDEHRVLQIVNNLVSNAIKFTDEGVVRIRKEACGKGVYFVVQDTGQGMTREQAIRAMQPFSQVDATVQRRHGGTGLGLAIVQALVELMGGELTVQSAVGQGSTFRVFLPLPPVLEPTPEAAAASDQFSPPPYEGRRFLVVDDNEVNLMVARALLCLTKADVLEARSGKEALKLCHEQAFDVILMDISMPGMDGTEVLARLRREANPNQHAPIVAVTAHAMLHEKEAFLAQGFDGFMSKPISGPRLYEELLRHQPANEEPPSLPGEGFLDDVLRRRSV